MKLEQIKYDEKEKSLEKIHVKNYCTVSMKVSLKKAMRAIAI